METLSEYLKIGFLPFIISLVAVWILHPQIIKVALLKEIVDTPNARKLQKEPVPILGGVAVFFGIFMSLMFSNIVIECSELFILLTAMLLMLYIGAIDDVLDISPQARLAAQIGAALVLVYLGNGYVVADLMGLFGIGALPEWAAVPLSVFAIVGIINATNLIDGVDGLSSGFGMMACLIFSVVFFNLDDVPMVVRAPRRWARCCSSSCTTSSARAPRCSSATAAPSRWASSWPRASRASSARCRPPAPPSSNGSGPR